MKLAILKFNNGNGALLCNHCRKIIAYGFAHEDKHHFCDSTCRNEYYHERHSKVGHNPND